MLRKTKARKTRGSHGGSYPLTKGVGAIGALIALLPQLAQAEIVATVGVGACGETQAVAISDNCDIARLDSTAWLPIGNVITSAWNSTTDVCRTRARTIEWVLGT
jgi:hypothetical protein